MTKTAHDEDELRRLNRAYRALCLCGGHVARATSELELGKLLCQTMVDVGGYRLAWVGVPEADHPHDIRRLAFAGVDNGYLDDIHIAWSNDAAGSGPTGTAIRTGKPSINRDSGSNPDYAPWRDEALRRGFRSSIALPLLSGTEVLGALSLYSAERDAFDTDECELLTRFADNLAFGIASLRTRHTLELREEQLRQAVKFEALGQIAGGVVHDVNNLLQVIQLCGSELLDMLPISHAGHALAREVLGATRSASQLTQQILAFSQEGVAPAPRLSLSEVVNDMAPIVRRTVGPQIQVELSTDPNVGAVAISPTQVEQLVLNLVVNARDAMPDGGVLSIGVRNVERASATSGPSPIAAGSYVELMVHDTGIGMEPKEQSRIFEPFYTTKAAAQGTGLGLAVVQRILQQRGGGVEVESQLGIGTTFRLFLPIAP